MRFISSCLLPYLLFTILIGSSSRGSADKDECSSYCGDQSIRYPFRLKNDPQFCGKSGYELICDGNKALILELHPGKYHVTQIHYSNSTAQIVDANLANGQCSIPSRFPSCSFSSEGYNVISSNWNYQLMSSSYASFINCSIETQDDANQYVPCLSGKDSFVYVIGEVSTFDIMLNCSFLSQTPTDFYMASISITDVFQVLKKGFTISWGKQTVSRFLSIRQCLTESSQFFISKSRDKKDPFRWLLYPFIVGNGVLDCIHQSVTGPGHYTSPLASYVCLDTAIALIVIALLVRFILLPLCIHVFLTYEYWKMMVPNDSIEKFLHNQQTLSPARYAYTDIIAMTNHFKEKLGQGGFGSVYKGKLLGGHLVAVKMLRNSMCNGDDFINEVSTIGRIHHLNVVRLVGFCSDGSKRALIYEFMPNGSLDKYIFSSNQSEQRFTKDKLNEIALGVARGIDYLHRGCDMRILHFDIKPHNILLDQNFNPKVADFGLAKLYPKDHSLVDLSVARGTVGYIAPELVSRSFGLISYKSDVYSFGMLLMEMAGERRNVNNQAENSSQVYYPSWIYDRLQQGELVEVSNSINISVLERKLCKIGLWCIQMRPSDRPSMRKVIEMLEANEDVISMPPKPFMSVPGPVSIRDSCTDISITTELSIIPDHE